MRTHPLSFLCPHQVCTLSLLYHSQSYPSCVHTSRAVFVTLYKFAYCTLLSPDVGQTRSVRRYKDWGQRAPKMWLNFLSTLCPTLSARPLSRHRHPCKCQPAIVLPLSIISIKALNISALLKQCVHVCTALLHVVCSGNNDAIAKHQQTWDFLFGVCTSHIFVKLTSQVGILASYLWLVLSCTLAGQPKRGEKHLKVGKIFPGLLINHNA